MPKLPRGAGKATTKERAKKPAGKRAAAKPTAEAKTAAAKKANGGTAAKPNGPAAAKPNGPAATKPNGGAAAKPATTRKKPAASRPNGGATKTATKTSVTRPKPKPAPELDFRHRPVDRHAGHAPVGPRAKLTDDQRRLLGDLFAVVEEHSGEAAEEIDRDLVERAFVFSCDRHADQRRASGEDFITHPVGVAKICAGMRLDTATLCAALLHDTVEDTSASLDEVTE